MIFKIFWIVSEIMSRLFPVKFKTWIYDEFLPLFAMVGVLFFYSAFSLQFSLIAYTCWKSKGWILFWLGYHLWVQYDLKSEKTLKRKIHWLPRLGIFKYIRRYFPLRLIKKADLPPDKNYILACYPHGVIPYGSFFNLCTTANNVEDLFPNIDIGCATMAMFFHAPLGREFLMAMGSCSVDKEVLLYRMKSPPPKAVLVYPGGLQDIIYSRPGSVYTITKINRKGFIKVALESGAALVPVFSFGEQNTLVPLEPTWPPIVTFNKWLRKHLGWNICWMRGRGGTGSFLPHRRPITTVVGKPIKVLRVENPSAELVDEYHEKFFKALYDLFEEYKGECDEAGDAAQLIMK